jgi:demethoxyubiquinone hydroxylase (CLK1/Coq7/Cat5 family)
MLRPNLPFKLILRTCSDQAKSSVKIRLSKAKKRELIDKILRVDHAGEYGADRIYAGQVAVLGMFSVVSFSCHLMGKINLVFFFFFFWR